MSSLPQRPRPGSQNLDTSGRKLPAKPQVPRSRNTGQRPTPQRQKPESQKPEQPQVRKRTTPPVRSEPIRRSRVKPREEPNRIRREDDSSVYRREDPPHRRQEDYREEENSYREESPRSRREKTSHVGEEEFVPENFGFADVDDGTEVIEHLNDEVEDLNMFEKPENEKPYVESPAPKKGKKKRAPKESKAQGQSIAAGGRGNLFIVRAGIIGLVVFFVGLGVKSIVAPPYIPSPDDVISIVNEENNSLGFPVGAGSTFAQSFATSYLTVIPGENIESKMAKYTTESLASEISANAGAEDVAQEITEGPFVSPTVNQIDEFNAVFTVSAAINGKWVYLEIPVRADETKSSFVVSSLPSFVSPPAIISDFAPENDSRTVDEAITSEVSTDVENFFKAWAASDTETLTRLISPDATPEVNLGLRNAVSFNSLSNIVIYEAAGDQNLREGTVEIVWTTVQSKEEDDSATTYTQAYDITLEKLSDGRWYVKDVTSGSHMLS